MNLQNQKQKALIPVIEQQWPIDEKIVVSVSCAAYNHEPFIRDCIGGFLIQRTSFPIEILIHDDDLWCYLATKGKVRYFSRSTSIYRRGLHGIVLGSHPYYWALISELWNRQLEKLFIDPMYHEILRDRNFNV